MTRRIFCKVLLVIVAVFSLLALSGILLAQGRSEDAFERVREVQERHTDRLMAIEGVVGTAVGLDPDARPIVQVFTERAGIAGIPKKLDDVPVEVVVTGAFYALPKPSAPGGSTSLKPTSRWPRPVPIGVSTGNAGECSAGTIGCRVTKAGAVYALSNNHVYALENDAPTGSEVLQPGLYDTSCIYKSDNVIGTLSEYVEIYFDGTANTVDAAVALSSTANLGKATPSNGYGTPKSTTAAAYIGQPVQKYGRTTSLTKGTVSGINATVNVGYGSGTARFVGQIVVYSSRSFIKAGDSGSLLVTNPGKNPVGLLFAGTSSGQYAIANPIDLVLGAFGVSVDGE